MGRALRPLLLNSLLLLGSLVAAAAFSELALRLIGFSHVAFYRPDATLGLRLRPNVEGRFNEEGSAILRTNSAGFRDYERAESKPPGWFRIAVLGDSYVEAKHVNLEEGFTALLEKNLNACGAFDSKPVEVLNFGVSGYGSAQQLLAFRHIASRYEPDLVIATFFTGNDVRNNSRDLEPEKIRPFFVSKGERVVEDLSFAQTDEFRRRTDRLHAVLTELRALRIVQAAYFIKDRLPAIARAGDHEPGIDNGVFSPPRTTEWRDAWTLTERLLAQLAREVRDSGARLLLVSLSAGVQVHPDPEVRERFVSSLEGGDLFYPDRRIEKIADTHGIDFLMLAPEMQKRADRERVFFHGFPNTRMGTGHWNEAGHRVAAELVAGRLCPHGSSRETPTFKINDPRTRAAK